MQTYYQKSLVDKGLIPDGIDPRHVEAYARLQYGTLSHLDWPEICRETKIAIACIREDVNSAESLAESFGL